jgi:hypothetical protein
MAGDNDTTDSAAATGTDKGSTADADTTAQGDGQAATKTGSATDTVDGDGKALGDAGKGALDKERKARQEAEKRAREAEKRAQDFEDRDKSDLEKATSKAEKAEQRAQALIDRTVKAEIRAAAAAGYEDPEDAAVFLDLASYAGDDGEIDTDKIKVDLTDLLKRKPHLAKQAGRKGPKPDPSQGAKPGGAPDLAVQIAEAEKAGNHGLAIRLKRQQSALTTQT